jgi:hypothetical protein
MHPEDPLEHLLAIDDPLERSLALKSRHVQPYHLRLALQDEDPSIREQAILHPAMSRELLREVMAGDDHHLKETALQRPDLTDHELELASGDPDMAVHVARHPACTPKLREKLALAQHIPEGVREFHRELVKGELAKNIGYITFPNLGEGRVHTEPMVVDPSGAVDRLRLWGAPKSTVTATPGAFQSNQYTKESTMPSEDRKLSGYVKVPDVPKVHPSIAADIGASTVPQALKAKKVGQGKVLAGRVGHETQHAIFARLGQRYGGEPRKRVARATLDRLPEQQRQHLARLMDGHGVKIDDPDEVPEETIAYLHNYLTDPFWRDETHRRLKMDKDSGMYSQVLAREAWKNLQRAGERLRPEDIGVKPQTLKFEGELTQWLLLNKTESNPSEQLGWQVAIIDLIDIAQFLTGKVIPMEEVRRAIYRADGDAKAGVLAAYGLDSPQGKDAFEATEALKMQKSEDILKAPKQVYDILGVPVAEEMQQAYQNNRMLQVKLSGKHAAGSYIMEDSHHDSWLLKPGSNKQSPASGARESTASQSRREAAFAEVARLWGITQVAEVGLVAVDGKEVAAIKMWPMDFVNIHRARAEDPNLPSEVFTQYERNGDLFKWAIMDYVLGNPDRHGNNVMVGAKDDGWPVGLIDHGSAFAGFGFDPGHDEDSFVPYYLRCRQGPGFNMLDRDEQLAVMATATHDMDELVRQWAMKLDPDKMASVLHRYGIDPAPELKRLKKVQGDPMVESFTRHINELWLKDAEVVVPSKEPLD